MEFKYLSPYEIKLSSWGLKKNTLVRMPLSYSITEFGLVSPIILDIEGNVIDGNERLEIAREMRLNKVPVLQTELTVEQGRKYALVHNHIQQLAGWNFAAKKSVAEELNINKHAYHMADEIREMDDIDEMFREDDAISLFDLADEPERIIDEDNTSGL